MTDDLPDGLPSGFALERADHMDRVETDDGRTWVVLVSARTNGRQLVREDVVDYQTLTEHPMAQGLAGLLAILAALVVPIALAVGLAVGGGLTGAAAALVGTGGGIGGLTAANRVRWDTQVYDWMRRFDEWYSVKHLVLRGEAA